MSEPLLRLTIFMAVLLLLLSWESLRPQRPWQQPRGRHLLTNIGLLLVDVLVQRFTLGAAAIAAAVYARQQGWGLLPLLPLPASLLAVVGIILLDLAIYGQHVLSHRLSWLWRLHRVHHCDLDLDVSTALRFHPLEILLSLLYKVLVVMLLGVSPAVVLWFEVLLNSAALFNHANIRLPARWERPLRRVLVTPAMHRVHHSVHAEETHSNFGFMLSCWDRLFATYRAQPQDGHEAMALGLPQYRRVLGVKALLLQPFRATPKTAALRRQ